MSSCVPSLQEQYKDLTHTILCLFLSHSPFCSRDTRKVGSILCRAIYELFPLSSVTLVKQSLVMNCEVFHDKLAIK